MQEPAPKIVNVFEVLKKVAAGAVPRNASSAIAACAADIRHMMDGARTRERWALMMVDASAKLPEPLLGGLNLHLGDYDQCLRARAETFAGRYCLVAAMGQRVATCVPSTCSRGSLDELLANGSAGAVRVPEHTCRAADDPYVFHPATAALGIIVLLAVLNALCWFLLTLDSVRARLPGAWLPSKDTAVVMSPVTAWRKISGARAPVPLRAEESHSVSAAEAGSAGGGDGGTGTATPAAAEGRGARLGSVGEVGGALAERVERAPEDWGWALSRMSALGGVRTLSMVWVVLGHRAALMPRLPALDRRLLPDRMKQWVHVYVTAGLFAVDTFLFLSGCVMAFTMSCKPGLRPRSWRQLGTWLPTLYLHRYLRLTPLMAFIIVFYAGGLLYLGDGPLWDEFSAFDVNSCRTNWWPNFLYIHNYYNNRNMCVGHSWYLAVEMQLFVISPLLVLPVVCKWNSGRFNYGRWVFALFLILSILIPFAISGVYDLSPAPDPIGDQQQNLAHAELMYIPAHTRAAPWVMGVGAGAWAARVLGGRRSLGRWTRRALWATAATVLVGLPVVLTGALRTADTPSRWGSAVFVALSKPLWSLGLGAVVMLCATGNAPRLDALLSWEPLAVLGRLTFAVYLLHPTVQSVTGWSTRGTTVVTDVVTIPLIVSDVVLTFLLALPVSILIESPFIALGSLQRRRASPSQERPTTSTAPADDSAASAQAPEQPRQGDATPTACSNVSDWCRERLQSFRANIRTHRSRSHSGNGNANRNGSTNEPTEMQRYSLLTQEQSPVSLKVESPLSEESPDKGQSPSEQSVDSALPLTREQSLTGEAPSPSRPSTSSFLGSAVSSSDESTQPPLVNGSSSEKFTVEDESVGVHTPARTSSKGESATLRSQEEVSETGEDIATDTV